MRVFYTTLTILTILLIGFLSLCAYIAYALTLPGLSPVVFEKSKIGRGTDVVFRSKDNIQLAGWYFPGTNARAIMFVQGAGNQNRANEVYGTPVIAKYFLDKGYTILMFDLRGTGESSKTRISFGQYERFDVAGAFEYLKTQEFGPKDIGIISDSLGAIATIMAASEVKEAGGIVLDSPASRVKPIVSHIMKNEKNIPSLIHPTSFFFAKLLYKIDVDKVSPINHIGALRKTPLLFLHGENDTLVSPKNSEELLVKVLRGQRIVFPGSKHVETFKDHPDLYLSSVSDFFDQNLK